LQVGVLLRKFLDIDAEKHDELPGESAAFNIKFAPQKEILLRGVRIPPLFDELAALGKTSVKADISSVPELNDFDPEHCYLSWDINIETNKTEAKIRSVFIFVKDSAAISIRSLETLQSRILKKLHRRKKAVS